MYFKRHCSQGLLSLRQGLRWQKQVASSWFRGSGRWNVGFGEYSSSFLFVGLFYGTIFSWANHSLYLWRHSACIFLRDILTFSMYAAFL